MWNLVGSYYHGTNWYASSLLTAVQPWSGFYESNMPVVWATAHVTQFTEVGWHYLKNGKGSGELPKGGYFNSLVDPTGKEFTLVVVKISRDHASCTRPPLPDFEVEAESVTFQFSAKSSRPSRLNVWYSNFEANATAPTLFEKRGDIIVSNDGSFTLNIPVGAMITVSTVSGAVKGSPSKILIQSHNFHCLIKTIFKGIP